MLTIAIPTFNREKQLLNTLKNLECQTNQNFKIVISDNNSNYDVQKMLISNFDDKFLERINIRIRNVNVGGDANIVGMFELVTKGWMWIVSDDDFEYEDAVDKIYSYIYKYSDVAVIQFSFFDYLDKDVVLSNLNEFINLLYCRVNKKTEQLICGDFASALNKIYNVDILRENTEMAFKYSNCCMTTGIVMLSALRDNKKVIICRDSLADVGETHWNRKAVSLGAATIANIDFDLSPKMRKKLLYIINLPYKIPLNYWMLKENHYDKDKFLERLYYGFYRYHLPFKERVRFYCRMKLFSIDFIYKIHLMLRSVEKKIKANRT